ncbi:unnamed protein product [Kluyveromyces dobzhanskii CBS 2104]|uniref:WGS project CCBQ000000000 data, contig 00015 n=1 Tax=Kluyveromyces dobzhanskii CBS 2104 TaxID=1427455 RepID=A0A0A8LC31_9SACH|nr:unnamed protein product [Kluyveromyces dobzhanskii CBS 2104]
MPDKTTNKPATMRNNGGAGKQSESSKLPDVTAQLSAMYEDELQRGFDPNDQANLDFSNNPDQERDDDQDNEKDSPADNDKVRKRRKIIKSCTFCRKRKLKCDRKRPMCTGCKMRGLHECVYTDGYNFDISHDELYDKTPNLILLNEIEKLKEKMKGQPDHDQKIDAEEQKKLSVYGISKKEKNPLLQCQFVLKKKSRVTRYGCTAVRAIAGMLNEKTLNYLKEVLIVHKRERCKLKAKSGNSMLYELQRIESPWSLGMLIADLPKHSELCEVVKRSFKYEGYQAHQIFSEEKVTEFLTTCFKVINDRIVELVPHRKLNYYPIGIVLSIYSMLLIEVPCSFITFFVMLIGQSTAKVYYVERVQFLLLVYIWRASRFQNGGDNSHLSPLVEIMVSAAVDIGLNDCIDELPGEKRILKNIWNWILFHDLIIAFDIGRTPLISPQMFDDELLLQVSEGSNDDSEQQFGATFMRNLQKFIYYARSILHGIHTRDKLPDLDLYSNHLETLLTEVWPDHMEFFTSDRSLPRPLSIASIVIVLPILSFICTLRSLKRIQFKDDSVLNSNSLARYTLMAIDLIQGGIIKCYQLDHENSPVSTMNSGLLPSHVRFFIENLSSHWMRIMFQSYEVLLSLTLDLKSIDDNCEPFQLDSAPLPKSAIPFSSYFKGYKMCAEQFSHPNHLPILQYFSNRSPFIHMFFFERTARLVIERIIAAQSLELNAPVPSNNPPTTHNVNEDAEQYRLPAEAVYSPTAQTNIEQLLNEVWKDTGMFFEDMFDPSTGNDADENTP